MGCLVQQGKLILRQLSRLLRGSKATMKLSTKSALLILALIAGGCRSVTVNVPPGASVGQVIINQSYAPGIGLLSGINTNTVKSFSEGAAKGAVEGAMK